MPANTRAAIYGVITVSLLLAAERLKRESYAETVAALALAMLINWLAHSYAEYASRRLREGSDLSPMGLLRSMLHELPMLGGAALPVLAHGAAMRFFLTRLHDWFATPEGALVKPKDPLEYERKLAVHRASPDLVLFGDGA